MCYVPLKWKDVWIVILCAVESQRRALVRELSCHHIGVVPIATTGDKLTTSVASSVTALRIHLILVCVGSSSATLDSEHVGHLVYTFYLSERMSFQIVLIQKLHHILDWIFLFLIFLNIFHLRNIQNIAEKLFFYALLFCLHVTTLVARLAFVVCLMFMGIAKYCSVFWCIINNRYFPLNSYASPFFSLEKY